MAPHVWHRPTATEDWYRDVLVEGEHAGASGYVVTLDEPRHVNVTGDNAYVVLPASMTFKVRGTEITQTGAILTVAASQTRRGLADSGMGLGERRPSLNGDDIER